MQRTSIGRKAVVYTLAAAAGAWLAFHPLASPAQGARAQQQKTAKTLPAPAPPANLSGGKTFSLQNGRLRTTAGAQRLMIENRDSANAELRAAQYAAEVSGIDAAIPRGMGRARYAYSLCDTIRARYPYGNDYNGFLSLSLLWKEGHCINNATMGYDAARLRNIPAAVVLGRSSDGFHAMLRLWDIYLDMNDGRTYTRASLGKKLIAPPYCEATRPEEIAAIGYGNLAFAEQNSGNYPAAIGLYSKALESLPKSANFYFGRGFCHYLSGQYGLARSDFAKTLEIDPGYGHAAFYLGKVKQALKK
jgi:tetratricopeptide (TPR) repeat protein